MQPGIKTKDFTINLPDDWQDKTMHIWSAPTKPGQKMTPNVVVVRETLPAGQPLHHFINKQMKELLNAGSELEIIKREDIKWQDRDATEVLFSWNNNGTYLKQRQVYVKLEGNELVNIVFSSSVDDYDQHLPMFEEIEKGFSWE